MLSHFHFIFSSTDMHKLILCLLPATAFFTSVPAASVGGMTAIKQQQAFLPLSFLLCQMSPRMTGAVYKKIYGIADLLKPQLNFQINLRIPDYYYSQVPMLSPPVTTTMDFLVSQDVLFRLFYNLTASNRTAPLVLKPCRHVRFHVCHWGTLLEIIQNQTFRCVRSQRRGEATESRFRCQIHIRCHYFWCCCKDNLGNMRIFTQNKKKLLLIAIYASTVKTANRLYWVHPINKLRCKLGDHIKLDIKHDKYPDRFRKETRLSPAQFDELLLLTEQALQKHAHRKDVVSPRIRLYVTLK